MTPEQNPGGDEAPDTAPRAQDSAAPASGTQTSGASRTPAGDGQSDPEPLTEEIAREPRTGRSLNAARFEVRLRRLALALFVLVPLVWWLVSGMR